MKKIFIFLSFFCFCLNLNVFAYIVKNIKIEGLKNCKQSKVFDNIKIKKKDKVNQDSIDQSIKDILATGCFSDAEALVDNVSDGIILIFKVKEKNMISSIKLQGNNNIKTSKIMNKIELKKDGFCDDFSLNKAKSDITAFYKDQGYRDVVDSVISEDKNLNKVGINIYITEGNILKLNKISFKGVNSFSQKKLLKTMKIKLNSVFKEDDYKKGIESVISLYKNNGFIDVKVNEVNRILKDDKTFIDVKLNIDEGKKYNVGNVSFSGNKNISKDVLEKYILLKRNKVFSQNVMEQNLFLIQNVYAENGYIKASIRPDFEYDGNKINVVFNIIENGIVYISNIYVSGNNKTKDYVIQRSILVKSNEVFNVSKIKRSQEKIFSLGFFSNIQLDVEPVDENNVNIVFNVEESATGSITAGAGYSSQDGVVGQFQLSKSNLFGRGQKASLLWEFGNKKQNYQVSFYDPYFLESFFFFWSRCI